MNWWRLCSGQRRRNIGKKTGSEVVGLEKPDYFRIFTTSESWLINQL